jgi:hypothetical protein
MWAKGGVTGISAASLIAFMTAFGSCYETLKETEWKADLAEQTFRHELIKKGITPENLELSEDYWQLLVRIQIVDTTGSDSRVGP